MAQSTYNARVLVLRKTKLGESDLILSLLAQDGSQIRAVAKGARKPTSQFSSRLELYSQADVLLAQGRSLDIVKEARLVAGNAALRESMELAACAAPIVELLDRITQPGLEVPKLFPLTQTALDVLASADSAHGPAICAAWLLKAFAFLGIRPSLDAASPTLPALPRKRFPGQARCWGCAFRISLQSRSISRASSMRFAYAKPGRRCTPPFA